MINTCPVFQRDLGLISHIEGGVTALWKHFKILGNWVSRYFFLGKTIQNTQFYFLLMPISSINTRAL